MKKLLIAAVMAATVGVYFMSTTAMGTCESTHTSEQCSVLFN